MINNSYLLGLYGMTDWAGSTGASSGALTSVRKAQPTAPWSTKYDVPKPDELVRTAMAGRRIVDENAAQLDVKGASSDYRKLFALYQGLETLNALNNRAAVKGVGATELALLGKRFSAGLDEIGTYVGTTELSAVRLVLGSTSSLSKSTGGVPRDNANSITGPIHEGSPDSVVAAFSGDVAFDITIRQLGVTTSVPIDLADMGTTPRSLTNVLEHINAKLEATGFNTRIGREQIKAEPRTISANGKTVTLPTGPDRWALAVRGDSTETLGFTATQTSDAVYVVQASGTTGGHQLLKFQSDGGTAPPVTEPGIGDTHWVEGRSVQTSLPPGIETVRASATGPDGSLWIVAGPPTRRPRSASAPAGPSMSPAGPSRPFRGGLPWAAGTAMSRPSARARPIRRPRRSPPRPGRPSSAPRPMTASRRSRSTDPASIRRASRMAG